MKQRIINTLENKGFVRAGEHNLARMTMREMMKDFIFPHCLGLPRSNVRYPRISGEFMELMALHGEDFLKVDYELGSILLECAMQRLSRHPDLPWIDYQGNLPEEYKPYSAASINPDGINGCPDEPGLWGDEEVRFIVNMLPICLRLRDSKFRAHAELILFQLLAKLQDGTRFCPFGRCQDYLSVEELWTKAEEMFYQADPSVLRHVLDYFIDTNWRDGMKLYQKSRFVGYPEDYLLGHIDLEKETYYTGWKRKLLKVLDLYTQYTRQRIVEEIWA